MSDIRRRDGEDVCGYAEETPVVEPNVTSVPEWAISSSSGRERFSCRSVLKKDLGQGGMLIKCSVCISGDFWPLENSPIAGDLTLDFKVNLPQILILKSKFHQFLAILEKWLEEWPTKLPEGGAEFSFDITDGSAVGQKMCIFLGRVPGVVHDRGKTSFTVEYDSRRSMCGKWSFVVDQSCIGEAVDGLRGFLSAL